MKLTEAARTMHGKKFTAPLLGYHFDNIAKTAMSAIRTSDVNCEMSNVLILFMKTQRGRANKFHWLVWN